MTRYAGYRPSLKESQKEQGQHPVILIEQTWSINDLLLIMNFYELASASGKFLSCGIQRVIPSKQDSAILHAPG